MAGDKYRLPGPLQLDAGVARRRAAKLVMNRHGFRLIHDRAAELPETRAVIGVLVVRRPVSFVEAAESFEGRPSRNRPAARNCIREPPDRFRVHTPRTIRPTR